MALMRSTVLEFSVFNAQMQRFPDPKQHWQVSFDDGLECPPLLESLPTSVVAAAAADGGGTATPACCDPGAVAVSPATAPLVVVVLVEQQFLSFDEEELGCMRPSWRCCSSRAFFAAARLAHSHLTWVDRDLRS